MNCVLYSLINNSVYTKCLGVKTFIALNIFLDIAMEVGQKGNRFQGENTGSIEHFYMGESTEYAKILNTLKSNSYHVHF